VYKEGSDAHTRKLITIEEAKMLVRSMMDIRDQAMLVVLLKTGVRREELISMEVDDIDWKNQSITLKPKAKRTNRVVLFDNETEMILRRWMSVRAGRKTEGVKALWVTSFGRPMASDTMEEIIRNAAIRVGLYDPNSDQLEDHFTAHGARHWFTTTLRRAGMPTDFIKVLRGDARPEAMSVYDHVSFQELRKSYLAHIPQFGI